MSSRPRRKRSQKRTASRRRAGFQRSPNALIVIGAAVAVLALVGFATFQVIKGAGAASDFEVDVYQGQEMLGGSEVNFKDLLENGKPVVLNFWGGDCPPCRAEMPAFQRVYERHRDDIILLGLDVGAFFGLGTRQSALNLLSELNITYPAGGSPNRKPPNNYSVNGLPATIFFGADGKVFRRWDGAITEDRMSQIVNSMLEPS